MEYVLVTSNMNKLREFQRLGIKDVGVERGRDLQEVKSDPITVVLYKAKEAGLYRIVEDTSFDCEGADLGVNIKWKMEELNHLECNQATWRVLLGVHDQEIIHVYEGVIRGHIMKPHIVPDEAFGFDPFFVPNGCDLSLYELDKLGRKDIFSARRLAVEAMLRKESLFSQKVSDLQDWDGEYQ